jgi:hypothetical protein
MPGRFSRFLAVVATVFAAAGVVRLADAVGKKELVRAGRELAAERLELQDELAGLEMMNLRLAEDMAFLSSRIASFSKREPYLVIDRRASRLTVAVLDKTLLETKYRLRGPDEARDALSRLPFSTLEVLGRRQNTDWRKPDWLYRLEGVEPPADSLERLVRNAFGAGELFLGGDIVIHGKVVDGVPAEAVDHAYIELDEQALKAVLDAAKPGTRVLIR